MFSYLTYEKGNRFIVRRYTRRDEPEGAGAESATL
jgi:hypothetical protein